jgi:ABC-type transport system involved in multi-copper enzyme maturation permease subunit
MDESYFATFLTLQLLVVLFLTPAYVAGAIAEEKDRRTLEFLLATDLRNQEIVLSKLLSRLANLAFLLLGGLPILSLMQFLGGVDPLLVLGGFLATGITMVALAGLSILLSVYAKRPRDAIALTYFVMIAYLGLTPVFLVLLKYVVTSVGALPLTFGSEPFTVLDLTEALCTGNIFIAYSRLAMAVAGGARLTDVLPEMLRDYAWFHLVVTGVCVTWAVARLRAVALKQASEPATGKAVKVRLRKRPPVGSRPMRWKEVHAEPGLRLGRVGRVIVIALVAFSFVPAVWILIDYYLYPPTISRYDNLGVRINIWLRFTSTIVSCLLLLAVAARAAGSISGERDRQTLDGLLTTPLASNTILSAKWLGSVCSVRRGWWWLGAMWFVGAVLGGLNVLAVPLLAAYWLSVAALFAVLGLWFSTTSRTTQRATVLTLLSAVFIGGGHWLVLGLCCYMPLAVSRTFNGRELDRIAEFHAFGLTPPAAFAWLAFRGDEHEFNRDSGVRFTTYGIIGMAIWAAGAWWLWRRTRARFRQVSGRVPLRQWRPPPASRGSVVTQR